MWVRFHAWLHAEREKDLGPRSKDHPSATFPDLSGSCSFYVVEFLRSIGWVQSGGFGVRGVSWAEIQSWASQTGHDLEPWEAEALFTLSSEYASQYNRATKPDCPPPWQASEEENKKSVSDSLEAILDSMMAQRSKKAKPHEHV